MVKKTKLFGCIQIISLILLLTSVLHLPGGAQPILAGDENIEAARSIENEAAIDVFVPMIEEEDSWDALAATGLWAQATDLGNNWLWLNWFGYFNVKYSPWIYHMEHNYLYPFGNSTESIVFWDTAMNAFWWTGQKTYPFLYRFSDNCWLYYQKGSKDPRWFYNYCTGAWDNGNGSCVNIAGRWSGKETVTVTCSAAGESETETISGSGSTTITQSGCNFSYQLSTNGQTIKRTGSIQNNSIQLSGTFLLPMVDGVKLTENKMSASGTVSGGQINLSGSGSAKGTYDGIAFSCTATTTAVLTRVSAAAIQEESEVQIESAGPSRSMTEDLFKIQGIIVGD